jgi:hypothetical protein
MVRSALHRGHELLFTRVSERLSDDVRARLLALIAPAGTEEDSSELEDGAAVLAVIRSDAGNVSLNTMLTEIAKLEAVRASHRVSYASIHCM